MRVTKNKGVVADFLISFKGVFIMKQELPEGSLSMDLSSCYRLGIVIWSSKSIGLLPCLSLMFLDAPLIRRDLTGLVLLKVSTLFIARWRGVKPSMS
jgi:hypothetical protein